ncbi:hypothetical protein [Streptomyces sp. NPDC057702]|uniref:hypothetical protein n=1 Tax=unclassified Streptomyces TaxID=2593676 RepID=UPI0036A8C044
MVLPHRVCRGTTVVRAAVPVSGHGARPGVPPNAWSLTSIVLTAMATALLSLAMPPGQRRLLPQPVGPLVAAGVGVAEVRRQAAARRVTVTGVVNPLWTIVVVLIIVRPGSTTGA